MFWSAKIICFGLTCTDCFVQYMELDIFCQLATIFSSMHSEYCYGMGGGGGGGGKKITSSFFTFREQERSFVWLPSSICIEYHMIITSVRGWNMHGMPFFIGNPRHHVNTYAKLRARLREECRSFGVFSGALLFTCPIQLAAPRLYHYNE